MLTDDLGSVRTAITTQAGAATVVDYIGYGPFGFVQYHAGQTGTNKGYTGQYTDPLSGLDYYVARYYDPVVGLFLSADTVQSNLKGFDPYAYVGNNPETLTDPSGHDWNWGAVDEGLAWGAVGLLTVSIVLAVVATSVVTAPALALALGAAATIGYSTGLGITTGMIAAGITYGFAHGFNKLGSQGGLAAMGEGGLGGGAAGLVGGIYGAGTGGLFGGVVAGDTAGAGELVNTAFSKAVTPGWVRIAGSVASGVVKGVTTRAGGSSNANTPIKQDGPPENRPRQDGPPENRPIPGVGSPIIQAPTQNTGYSSPTHRSNPPSYYTVMVGNTLWGIAAMFYGSGLQWQRIYQANRGVIGGNPNLIYAGERLVIPR